MTPPDAIPNGAGEAGPAGTLGDRAAVIEVAPAITTVDTHIEAGPVAHGGDVDHVRRVCNARTEQKRRASQERFLQHFAFPALGVFTKATLHGLRPGRNTFQPLFVQNLAALIICHSISELHKSPFYKHFFVIG